MFATEYALIARLLERAQVKVVALVAEEQERLSTYRAIKSEHAETICQDIRYRIDNLNSVLTLLTNCREHIARILKEKRNVHARDHQ